MPLVWDHISSVFSLIKSSHCCATQVSFKTICGFWDAVREHSFQIDETSHGWTSASCHFSVSSSPSILLGLEHHVIHHITATLQPDWPFLSRCDQINLDGSETMNDDITIWAPATCRSKNQLVFGQNKRLHRESNVVWRDTSELTGYWGSTAEKIVSVKSSFVLFLNDPRMSFACMLDMCSIYPAVKQAKYPIFKTKTLYF